MKNFDSEIVCIPNRTKLLTGVLKSFLLLQISQKNLYMMIYSFWLCLQHIYIHKHIYIYIHI